MSNARADYACLGKKCRTPEGEATVYELPLASTRCPVCSSKRLQRLFTSVPMIGSGKAKQLDAFVRPSLDAAEAPKLKAQDDVRTGRVIPSFSVDPRNIAGSLASLGMNQGTAAAWGGRIGSLKRGFRPDETAPVTDPLLSKANVRTNIVARDD